MIKVTEVTIISGFLGAGKTTLIKKLLKEVYDDEQVVLIENEFGEIGIDGGFLQDAGVEITELTDAEFQAFKDATSSVYDTYVPQIDPAVYELVCNKIDALRG